MRNLYAASGRLIEAAALAQSDQPLSPTGGHQVLTAISRTNLSLIDAIGHIAGGHRLLESLARSLDIDISMYGDKHPEPSVAFPMATSDREIAG